MPGRHSDPSHDVDSSGWRRFSEFWTTLPGVLTGGAALLGAITALLAATHVLDPHPDVPRTSSTVAPTTPPTGGVACSDRRDNDGDGKTDFPQDPDCSSRTDPAEKNPACSDRRDNDHDGKTDYPQDPDCSSPTDFAEKQ